MPTTTPTGPTTGPATGPTTGPSTEPATGASTAGSGRPASSPAATTTARRGSADRPRRSWVRLWVPNQHGAWAMLLLPLVVGVVRAGLVPVHVLLLVAWLVAYLAYFAATVWLRSRRKPRYRTPVVAYAAATAVTGGALLVVEPTLVRWGVVYAPLLAASLLFSVRRAERALVNDLLTVVATSLMAVIAFGLARPDDGAWLPGAGWAAGWALASATFAYLAGTALYVKTMIRERGNHAMYAASVVYHVLAAAVFAWWLPWVGAFLAVAAVRAALVPRSWPRARPGAIGVGEIVASVALGFVLLALPLV